jgi:hypothetical protein
MAKKFQTIPTGEKRVIRHPVMMNIIEHDEIKRLADIRNLTVSEYMRRTALGRKTDIDYESQIIIQLTRTVIALKDIHKQHVDTGVPPPEDIMLPVLQQAKKAILMVGNAKNSMPNLED